MRRSTKRSRQNTPPAKPTPPVDATLAASTRDKLLEGIDDNEQKLKAASALIGGIGALALLLAFSALAMFGANLILGTAIALATIQLVAIVAAAIFAVCAIAGGIVGPGLIRAKKNSEAALTQHDAAQAAALTEAQTKTHTVAMRSAEPASYSASIKKNGQENSPTNLSRTGAGTGAATDSDEPTRIAADGSTGGIPEAETGKGSDPTNH